MRILLAEDDSMIGSGLQKGLRQEGYTVDWVTDGKAAVLALETTPYGLLLLAMGLPRKYGMEVRKVLRREEDSVQ